MNNSNLFDVETPIQGIQYHGFGRDDVNYFMKRDDLIHPFVSGNKWRKLKYNIQRCVEQGKDKLVTCGGAYSNHLLAVAAAGASLGLRTLAFVRGDELGINSNFILRLCYQFGMELIFLSRSDYDGRLDDFFLDHPNHYPIPMGGANEDGIRGCAEILNGNEIFNHVFVGVGTGTTFRGLARVIPSTSVLHGVLSHGVRDSHIKLLEADFNADGYIFHSSTGSMGKLNRDALKASRQFTASTGILMDPIYMSPVLETVVQLSSDHSIIKPDDSVLIIHSGGNTGILSERWLNSV